MAVYVDKVKLAFGRMVMSHMIADDEEELHAMADRIGLKRSWYQADASTPHYDVSQSKKRAAIEAGAVELERREFVEVVKRKRERRVRAPQDDDDAPRVRVRASRRVRRRRAH